ncbi:MAG: MurR/RpiR family transcriptional regulator [Ignavibacteria bacterium]|jgi:DNA-binding MurR/RpiR family transcriptional regulator
MQEDLQKLKERIRSQIPNLTESQKLIANYIVENTQKFALSSIREIEEELNTSKSTIVRLAQVLGYNGFQELKYTFLKKIRTDLDPVNRYKLYLSSTETESNYLETIAHESLENINATLQVIDQSQYKKAVKLIESSEYVYTLGHGISAYLADLTSHLLNSVAIKSTKLRYGGITFAEEIVNIGKKDLIIALTFPEYSDETIEACSYAHKKGIKIIAITDKMTNEIIQYSDVHLQALAESQLSSSSIISPMMLLYSLCAQIGYDLKNKTLKTIDSIAHVRKEHLHGKEKTKKS